MKVRRITMTALATVTTVAVAGCGLGMDLDGFQYDAGSSGSGGSGGMAGAGATSGAAGSDAMAGASGSGGHETTGGTGGVAGASGTGGNQACGEEDCGPEACDHGTCGALACWNGSLCVAQRVRVPPGYWVDATEVTRSQYTAWLDTNPPTTVQDSYCTWNTTFAPASGLACANQSSVCQGVGCDNHPQVCVDWCDAYAYCRAVNKRLCGRIGAAANAFGDYASASSSQWFSACASGGMHGYPYGDIYEDQTCNGYDSSTGCHMGACTTVAVGSLSGCTASATEYSGVFDLSGNVREWEDSCNGTEGPGDWCRSRGGSFLHSEASLRCDSIDNNFPRPARSADQGFRCCVP
jgi:sulfatase modifying factor 1